MKVGIVAGEASGDYLGAGLMRALRGRYPEIEFTGIGGPLMDAVGMKNLYPMDRISIMGLDDLFFSLSDILNIRRSLFRLFSEEPVAIFIGIDVPDFNLGLERRLRKRGITTVHYVSPTVWAWRTYRIRKIKQAVSRMLTLFPFEARFYEDHQVPVTFVGHPIADEIDAHANKQTMRGRLGLTGEGMVVALLPGSRISELKRLGELFVQTARSLQTVVDKVHFAAPFANRETMQYFSTILAEYPDVSIEIFEGQSREVLSAADVALVASGTATLEAALHRTPLVVTYKGSWVSYLLFKLLAHVDHIAMPNHLLADPIVPELVQSQANVENLVNALSRLLLNPRIREEFAASLGGIMSALRCNANETAADAVAELLEHEERNKPMVSG